MRRKSLCGEDDHAPPVGRFSVFDWPPSIKKQPNLGGPSPTPVLTFAATAAARSLSSAVGRETCGEEERGAWGGGRREGEGLSKVAISQRNIGTRRHLGCHDANEAVHCL